MEDIEAETEKYLKENPVNDVEIDKWVPPEERTAVVKLIRIFG